MPKVKKRGAVAFPWSLRNRQKVKWTYLRLHTTHALDFWYRNRYCEYLLPYQKSSAWVVCRRRYGHFIFWRFRSDLGKATTPKKSAKSTYPKFFQIFEKKWWHLFFQKSPKSLKSVKSSTKLEFQKNVKNSNGVYVYLDLLLRIKAIIVLAFLWIFLAPFFYVHIWTCVWVDSTWF